MRHVSQYVLALVGDQEETCYSPMRWVRPREPASAAPYRSARDPLCVYLCGGAHVNLSMLPTTADLVCSALVSCVYLSALPGSARPVYCACTSCQCTASSRR